MDYVYNFLISTSSVTDIISISFTVFLFIFCIFLKCGIAPFYLWKPTFFKGLPSIYLFFYTYFYYQFIFLYLIYILFFHLNEIFIFNAYIVLIVVILGTIITSTMLFESLYFKSFIALSSIINSLFVMYMISTLSYGSLSIIL